MSPTPFRPPAASSGNGQTSPQLRSGALGSLPRHARAVGPHAYVPPRPPGDGLGPEQLLANARVEVAAEARRQAARGDELEVLATRYAQGIAEIAEAVDKAESVLVSDAVAVGVLIAEQLLGRALAEDGRAIAEIVRTSLREIPEEAATRVRVAPDDLPRVEVVLAGTKRSSVEFIADPELSPGDCIVESPGLIVDARLRERLAAIGNALRKSVATDALLPTHDEVSMDESPTLEPSPPTAGQEPPPDAGPSLDAHQSEDAISLNDAGPDAITLDHAAPGDETC